MKSKKKKLAPNSGGEGKQLKGFDGRDRITNSETGGTRTADILRRPGRHVAEDRGWQLTPPEMPAPNAGPKFRSGPSVNGELKRNNSAMRRK